MKVEVNILRPRTPYGFASIILSYSNPEKTEVELTVEYRNLYEFTTLTSGTAFDLFLVSCIVYGLDILLPREKVGFDGWSREIEVTIPVGNSQLFTAAKERLERALSFLTGDVWTVDFAQAPPFCLYKRGEKQKVYKEQYRKSCKVVNLFSGGMDSLIGAIDPIGLTYPKRTPIHTREDIKTIKEYIFMNILKVLLEKSSLPNARNRLKLMLIKPKNETPVVKQ